MAIALAFGLMSLNYSIGQFRRSGPGLFPLLVSCMLFVIGLITVVRARFVEPVPLSYNFKNIAIILISLIGFALISEYFKMLAGILFLVFFSSLAASSYSLARNLKIAAVLIGVALIFKYSLGLNLPLV